MGWKEDVDAVSAGRPHGPLLNGMSGGVFPCACGEELRSGWIVYRHGREKPPRLGDMPIFVDKTIAPDQILIVTRQ